MDLENVKSKPIAILGAGGVGKPCAADSKLAGREVRLWDDPRFAPKTLKDINKSGLKLSGPQTNLLMFERSGVAKLDLVTDNLAEAVKGAGLVIVATVALGHKALFQNLIPLLEDGQIVHIIPDNYGALLLRKMMVEAKFNKKVIVGSWGTSPYGARVLVKGGVTTNEINIIDRVCIMRGAAIPAYDTEAFVESAKYFPPFDPSTYSENGDDFGLRKGDTVLDIALSNVNPVVHVPGAILGAAVMQNFELFGQKKQNYSLYAHGLCPAIAQVQVDFWTEEEEVAKAAGTTIAAIDKEDFFSRSSIYGPEYMGKGYRVPFTEDYRYKQEPYGDGPFNLENRYVTEDVPIGCHLISQLGQKFGVKTPIVDSMIVLANSMLRRDLVAEVGYSLDYLGIGHMDKAQLNAWMREGQYV
ncbi:MAG: NAD/NADP octopine/nopaline dehydrogenase family protein [Deltaproteobacteria bacterium]|jgi:opine dehydrogenase|nr:NAD/NADP octopine/nopaline dehydrogenase family protein [Deltaproteobacteria bacterium]